MTSVEIPFSIAAALPTLSVLDITNEVAHEVARAPEGDGIVYVSPIGPEPWVVRVQERESGFFCDIEDLLSRLVPVGTPDRERLLTALLGPRTEQVPFSNRQLCLGRWQRILLVGFNSGPADWICTIVG